MRRLTLAALLLATAWTLSPDAEPPTTEKPGHTTLYSLMWTSQTTTALPGAGTIDAGLSIDGVLAVTALGEVELWQLRTLRTASLVVGDEAAPIEGLADAVLRVPSVGEPTVHGASSEAAEHVLTALYSMAEAHSGATRSTPYGTAEHAWNGSVRTTTGYRDLVADPAGRAEVSVHGQGELQGDAWTLDESITATRQGAVVFSAVDHIERHPAGSGAPVTLPLRVSQRPLEDPHRTRAASLSGPELLGALRGFTGGGGQATAELMWRGTARLALEPALTAEVGAIAAAQNTGLPQRELALDLLAHTRSGAAQAALLLALQSLEDHADYPMFLSRLAFVDAPTATTVAYAQQQMGGAGRVGLSAMHVAGSLAWHADLAGSPELTDALVDDLHDALESGDSDQRSAALAGLGNARQPHTLDTLTEATAGTTSDQRAAAHALRHWHGQDVRDVLLGLTSEGSSVQRAALSSLEGRPLDEAALAQLATIELDGANLQLATSVFSAHADRPQARDALHAMLGHEASDPRLRARIRSVLEPR